MHGHPPHNDETGSWWAISPVETTLHAAIEAIDEPRSARMDQRTKPSVKASIEAAAELWGSRPPPSWWRTSGLPGLLRHQYPCHWRGRRAFRCCPAGTALEHDPGFFSATLLSMGDSRARGWGASCWSMPCSSAKGRVRSWACG